MNLLQSFAGASYYYPDHEEGPYRLLLAVACFAEDLPLPFYALLDTGSEWCVLPRRTALDLGCDLEPDGVTAPLHTRFGIFHGRLERVLMRFAAEEGETIALQATCFVSPDWDGPMVIGWRGCLERLRFALDPGENAFYFAQL